MKLNEYQDSAVSTAVFPKESGVTYCTLALNGEAGEIAEKVKKVIRDNGGLWTDAKLKEVALELGDVLWYVAALSKEIGYDLNEIAQMNLDKLASRQARGKLQGSGDDR